MNEIIKRYRIRGVWHFTDSANIASIVKEGALLPLAELNRRRIKIPAPGGNQWSHDADALKGVDEYVHLAFTDDHPMLYRARQEGRITNPVWLQVNSEILLHPDVRFCAEVSNKRGAEILSPQQALERLDFDVLYTYMDWRDPDIRSRRQTAVKCEILFPGAVPVSSIVGFKNG